VVALLQAIRLSDTGKRSAAKAKRRCGNVENLVHLDHKRRAYVDIAEKRTGLNGCGVASMASKSVTS
jgi:hypothetical protein